MIKQLLRILFFSLLLAGAIAVVHTRFAKQQIVLCQQDKLPAHKLCYKTVQQRFAPQDIVWIDARSQDAFERKSIDANVYALRMDSNYQNLLRQAMPALLDGSVIVIFCDKNCSASEEIYKRLKDPDLAIDAEIYVLEGGWDAIQLNRYK